MEAGRPRTAIDLVELEKLGRLWCTLDEVAAFFDVGTTTIDERLAEDLTYEFQGKQLTFRQIFEYGRGKGLASLRRRQMDKALEGNPTMLIWLGKQLLSQRDNLELTGHNAGPIATTDDTSSSRQQVLDRIRRVSSAGSTVADSSRPDGEPGA